MGELTYGHIGGGKASHPVPMGASERLNAKSGRFAVNDDSGRAEVADAGDTDIWGFLESGDQTCSSTEGGTVVNLIVDITAKYRCPLAYDNSSYTVNYASSLLGESCDLIIINRVQYINPTLSTEDVVYIIGGKAASSAWTDGSVNDLALGDGYVEVMLDPSATRFATGTID